MLPSILMQHQVDWLADNSRLKICEKGRRTGITWCEAIDATMTAASTRAGGGDNVYYIGDSREKGIEFIRYVGQIAGTIARVMACTIGEYLFEDRRDDGETRYISAYRAKFASGHHVVALSSRPSNIRGLQGVVVIDEVAFHDDVAATIAAANALLIWGGKIRLISTHNGDDSPFCRIIEDTRKGIFDYSLHRVTFQDALDNGLYERVCMVRGWEPTEAGRAEWVDAILRSYGGDAERRDEELFAIPRRGSGAYFARALVRKCAVPGVPVLRFGRPRDWYLDDRRLAEAAGWCETFLDPALATIERDRPTVLGQDFGRDGDLSVIWVLQQEWDRATWRTALYLEMRRIPYDVQALVLFRIIDSLPMFRGAKIDARGNGQGHAEAAVQRYGLAMIDGVRATPDWYAAHFPRYRAAYEDRSILVPDIEDIATDHLSVVLRNGRPTMDDRRTRGADGEPRHGDAAVAGLNAWAAAEEQAAGPIEIMRGPERRGISGPARSIWAEGERRGVRGVF